MFLSKGLAHRKYRRFVLVGTDGGWGVVTEDQAFNAFEFCSSGGDWVIGSEFLDSGGMQAKARSPVCQDFERNNG